MPNQYLFGVDIGTYSSKGVLVEAETGIVIAEHSIEHGIEMPKPGWAEHDADVIWWEEFAQISTHTDRQERCGTQDHYLGGDQRFRRLRASGRRRWQTFTQGNSLWY